jgi:hypothetical protein
MEIPILTRSVSNLKQSLGSMGDEKGNVWPLNISDMKSKKESESLS